jgi:hypothetical protein
MARYFFNVHYGNSKPDDVGEELPDDSAAWKEATLVAGELFRDVDGKLQPGQEWSLEVTDEQRRPLYSISVNSRKVK